VLGKATSHSGRFAVEIDFESEYSTSAERNSAIVPSVTMIDGTRA
jgi:hypothetical protein